MPAPTPGQETPARNLGPGDPGPGTPAARYGRPGLPSVL